jgi:small-conductance mechanosensitive channel
MEIGGWVDAEQSTGRLVHVPNGMVFTTEVANYTEGFGYIWDE